MIDKSELYARDIDGVAWRKSTYSHDDDPPDNCVEVADLGDGAVAVRDSKNRGQGELRFTAGEWSAFTKAVHWGQF